MATSLVLSMEPVRSRGFAAITGTYAAVGTGLAFPARQFFIQNLTDGTLMFSFNGVDDHFPLPANGFWINDNTANQIGGNGFFLRVSNVLYVKTIDTPTMGSVYLSVIFAQPNS